MNYKFSKKNFIILISIIIFLCCSIIFTYLFIKSNINESEEFNFTDNIAFYINKNESVLIGEYLLYAASITQSTQDDYGNGVWEEVITLEDGSSVTFEDYMKRQIVEQIKMTKLLCIKADSYGISLTEEEKKSISSDAQEYLNFISKYNIGDAGIDLSTVLKVYEENTISDKVYNHILKTYKKPQNIEEDTYNKEKLEYFNEEYEHICKELSENWDYSTYVNHAVLSTLSLASNTNENNTNEDNKED